MSDFLIRNENCVRNGLCLISAFEQQNIFIANIEFCGEDDSIKAYNEWKNKIVMTAIPLSDKKQVPQNFKNRAINDVISINYIIDLTFKKKEFKKIEKEDVITPFVGGIIGDDFSSLLAKLWDSDCDTLWEYKYVVTEHYREVFNKFLDKKKKE